MLTSLPSLNWILNCCLSQISNTSNLSAALHGLKESQWSYLGTDLNAEYELGERDAWEIFVKLAFCEERGGVEGERSQERLYFTISKSVAELDPIRVTVTPPPQYPHQLIYCHRFLDTENTSAFLQPTMYSYIVKCPLFSGVFVEKKVNRDYQSLSSA